ncbi:hypothetical protein KVT40_004855 [Elsinoe batatas]|uniref:Uncharacterized protein n=1 Tax=Elsinoe batatas TaxID=2601811 RepID=A0A8K0L1J5_9PEZI|nr:hypothetical protein KVT40_004855 [Elsinoe batatas]
MQMQIWFTDVLTSVMSHGKLLSRITSSERHEILFSTSDHFISINLLHPVERLILPMMSKRTYQDSEGPNKRRKEVEDEEDEYRRLELSLTETRKAEAGIIAELKELRDRASERRRKTEIEDKQRREDKVRKAALARLDQSAIVESEAWQKSALSTLETYQKTGSVRMPWKLKSVCRSIRIDWTRHTNLLPHENLIRRLEEFATRSYGLKDKRRRIFDDLERQGSMRFGVAGDYEPFCFQRFWDILSEEPSRIYPLLQEDGFPPLSSGSWSCKNPDRQYGILAILAHRLLQCQSLDLILEQFEILRHAGHNTYAGHCIQSWAAAITVFGYRGGVVRRKPQHETVSKSVASDTGKAREEINRHNQQLHSFSGEGVKHLADEYGEWWGQGGS